MQRPHAKKVPQTLGCVSFIDWDWLGESKYCILQSNPLVRPRPKTNSRGTSGRHLLFLHSIMMQSECCLQMFDDLEPLPNFQLSSSMAMQFVGNLGSARVIQQCNTTWTSSYPHHLYVIKYPHHLYIIKYILNTNHHITHSLPLSDVTGVPQMPDITRKQQPWLTASSHLDWSCFAKEFWLSVHFKPA